MIEEIKEIVIEIQQILFSLSFFVHSSIKMIQYLSIQKKRLAVKDMNGFFDFVQYYHLSMDLIYHQNWRVETKNK